MMKMIMSEFEVYLILISILFIKWFQGLECNEGILMGVGRIYFPVVHKQLIDIDNKR